MKKETAIFAAGCFWHVQEVFSKTPGVIETAVGYTGGATENPNYEQVSSGKTNHAESIKITFDPDKVSYEELLDIFWIIHDPTSRNQQGLDIGTNYRSAIFYNNDNQKNTALKSKTKIQNIFKQPIVTQIAKASEFYPAEEYHQNYLEKNRDRYCNF